MTAAAAKSWAALVILSRSSSSFTRARYRHRPFVTHLFGTSSPSPSSSMTTATQTIIPPVPRRDETRAVYAGVSPVGWDTTKAPRQSNDSTESLLNPPVAVHDPYGWMRDDGRTDEEVLRYLKAENEYSKAVTEHLGGLQDELYEEFLSRWVAMCQTHFISPCGYWPQSIHLPTPSLCSQHPGDGLHHTTSKG